MITDIEELTTDVQHLTLDLQQMKAFCAKPLIIQDGEGIYVTNIDATRYHDAVSGIYFSGLGHRHLRMIEAIQQQHDRVVFVAPLHGASDTTIRYRKTLTEVTPEDLNMITLLSGGSEVTESALKFARQYHRQTGTRRSTKSSASKLPVTAARLRPCR